ncbi:MAG: DUF4271 domain-containing protein [Bacteroides sp.]|nr:DUF4271 domain-containing protein [Bacteroides sp.]
MTNDSIPYTGTWRFTDLSRCEDGPVTGAQLARMTVGEIPYTHGLAPIERKNLPGYDSGVLCLLIGMFLLLASNFRHYSTFFKNFFYDLFSVRRREQTFSVRTFSETGVQTSIVLIACFAESIIINSAFPERVAMGPVSGDFFIIGMLTVTALLYYLWQLAAYSTVGAIFTDKVSARMWMKGFNASQSLLSMMIVIPAIVVLFNPSASATVMILGIISYVFARLVFICKGFRLFYDNFGSLIYFILYLCSLEIVPLVLLYRAVLFIHNLLL